MNPGHELDALVAEQVMGYVEGVATGLTKAWTKREPCTNRLPNYSTDISAAWKVIEKLQNDNPGWRFMLLGGDTTLPYDLPSGTKMGGFFGWSAEFFGHEDAKRNHGQRHGEGHADTIPHAICLAALKAVGYNTNDSPPEVE